VTLDDVSRLRLPVPKSGFGLRSSLQHGPCAFIASVLACATMDGWNPSLLPLFQQNLSSLETRLGVPVGSDSSQRSLSETLDDVTLAALFARSTDPQRTIILSSSSPQASKVWSALPCKSRYHIPASQFPVAVRFRMGCVFPTAPPSPCTVCGINMDAYGRHLLTHRRYQIHNAVRDSVADFCKEARIPTITEPPFASTARAGNQLRPADLFIRSLHPSVSATSLCLDFAITNPLRPDYHQSSEVALSAAEAYTRSSKHKPEYVLLCRQHDFLYIPLVIESYGGILPSAIRYLDDIALIHSRNNNCLIAQSSHHLYTGISYALLTEICFTLLHSSFVAMG